MSEGPPPGAETKSQAPGVLTFLAGNIASLSAIGGFAVVVCSTLFLYGYLSVFDWRLIWIIDYSDIFKIGLVTLGVLASAIVFLLFALTYFLGIVDLKGRARKKEIWSVGILLGFLLAFFVFAQWLEPGPYQLYVAWAGMAIPLGGICIVAANLLTGSVAFTAQRALALLAYLFLAMGAAGSTFGVVTKYSEGSRYDVFLKDREMADVRLVLFTSHHTVLYSGNQVIVLPTTEILKMVAHPADQ
jgi:hypothetical protein